MTSEQKIKVIVEAAGECWHEWEQRAYAVNRFMCNKCGKHSMNTERTLGHGGGAFVAPKNPSPTDLNGLFRLAEKAGIGCGVRRKRDYPDGYIAYHWPITDTMCNTIIVVGDTPAEALLNALYEAVKENS